jgi:hypothetical protein
MRGGEVWRGPLFQAICTVMAMPPDQQHLASIYFYDGDDETIITFTDNKEIAERADFPSQGSVTLTARSIAMPRCRCSLQQLPRRRERRQTYNTYFKPFFKQVA